MADHWHRKWIEGRAGLFAIITTVAISIGGIVEIAPMFTVAMGPETLDGVMPYTPLELAGRDIYVREGCYLCHSQMVRPFRSETMRYGPWSRAGEYAYDRPFQLGSRRIGPDLHRVGGKYPDDWHYEHMKRPSNTSPGSVMPPFPWLHEWKVETSDVQATVWALMTLGDPYTQADIDGVGEQIQEQGGAIVGRLAEKGFDAAPDDEIIALIAYLQRLGVDGREAIKKLEAEAKAKHAGGAQ